MARVKIYTTPFCGYCVRAKRLLNERSVAFDETDVSGDSHMRSWLLETTGQRTVPQIFIDDVSYGGCDELHELDRRGELQRLLGEQ